MKIQSALTATALAGLLVLGTDYLSFAATGGSFILGHVNKAGQPSSLTNTGSGPALKLNTSHPGTTPPLAVNSHIKVASLNADLVDGKNAADLGVRTRVYEKSVATTNTGGFSVTLNSVPAGNYLVAMDGWIYTRLTGTQNPSTVAFECFLPNATRNVESWQMSDPQGFHSINSVAYFSVPTTQNLTVQCIGGAADYVSFSRSPFQVAFTRIDGLTKLAAAKPMANAPLHQSVSASR